MANSKHWWVGLFVASGIMKQIWNILYLWYVLLTCISDTTHVGITTICSCRVEERRWEKDCHCRSEGTSLFSAKSVICTGNFTTIYWLKVVQYMVVKFPVHVLPFYSEKEREKSDRSCASIFRVMVLDVANLYRKVYAFYLFLY